MIEVVKSSALEIYLHGEREAYLQGAIGRCPKEFSYEVGGVGRLEIDEDGYIELGDPVILKQEVSGGDCDFQAAITDWLGTWTPESLEQEMPNASFYMWHSHNTMGTFWSSQDEEWISNYIGEGLLVSLVGNHKSDWKCRVDTVISKGGIYYHHKMPCSFHVYHDPRPTYIDAAKKAVKERKKVVTIAKPVAIKPRDFIMGHFGGGDNYLQSVGNSVHALVPRSFYDEDVDLGTDRDTPPLDLPVGTTISRLANTHGAALRLYFTKAFNGESQRRITMHYNNMSQYTVDVTPALCKQIRNTFKMSKNALKCLVGSGNTVQYVPKGKGARWVGVQFNG